MLASRHRIHRAEEFRQSMRGSRAAGSFLVVHHATSEHPEPRIGFVVSKAVGGAVTRNLVKRRLRHLIAGRLDALPGGAMLVVRALPAAATASYVELGADLDRALSRAGVLA